MRFQTFHSPSKFVTASLLALATLSLSAGASAQNQYPVYSENFNSGYLVNNQTLSDQKGWVTNDEDTGNTYTYGGNNTGSIGQSDYVGNTATFSTGTNYAGGLGGVYGQSTAPGLGAGTVATPTAVTLSQSLPTATATSVVFSTDFQITQPIALTVDPISGLPTSYNAHDTFGLALTSASVLNPVTGSTAVTQAFSVTFQPTAANLASPGGVTDFNFDNIYVNGTKSNFGINLGTNTRYKLTVSVSIGGNYSVFYQSENAAGTLTGTQQLIATGTYTGGAVTGYAATWLLQDTNSVAPATGGTGANALAHTDAGTNVMYFDNVLVTVPEPSTYAMIGLGALGLTVAVRRARRARVA